MPTGTYKRKPMSKETKRKIGLANSIALKGNKLSVETKLKIGLASIGRKHPPRSDEWRRKQRLAKIGKKRKPLSEETKLKISQAHKKSGNRPPINKGKNCHFWKGGISSINELERKTARYKKWREAVFKRDNYTCQECGKRGLELNAHHIKEFAKYPKLRYVLKNGLTLCQKCHRKTDNYGSKATKL